MRPLTPSPRFAVLLALASTLGLSHALAQVDLPPLRATPRPDLERPRSFEPPARTPSSTATSSRRTTAKIPDPSIFDGSGFPPEERPERGLIAQFEMPGQEQPSSQNVQGPGDKQGGGGQGPGGDDSMSAAGGPQMGMGGLNIPGIPGMGGGGGGGTESMPQIPSLAGGGGGPPPIEEGDMGDRGKEGGKPGEGGEEGDPQQAGGEGGAPGAEDAPKVAAGQKGRALEKPQAMQIGDKNAKLAETDAPLSDAGKQLDAEQGEDRMAIKAASGNQPANRDSGTERGVDIPSNL